MPGHVWGVCVPPTPHPTPACTLAWEEGESLWGRASADWTPLFVCRGSW